LKSEEIIVDAGHHDREFCPVKVQLDLPEVGEETSFSLIEAESGRRVPCQFEVSPGGRALDLTWIVESLDKGKTVRYRAEFVDRSDRRSPATGVSLREHEGRVDIAVRGELFTAYCFGDDPLMPYLHPVIGPYGDPVTRGFPMIPDIPGEATDHKHHTSLWVAHGDVNGVDQWGPERRIVHRGFEGRREGPVYAELASRNDWMSPGGEKMVEDGRRVLVYNTPPRARIMDLEVAFSATEGDVTFGDTKEGGIASVRIAWGAKKAKCGRLENSYGAVGEEECWGRRAQWCDYSGPVAGHSVGIAIFDHPGNLRHPTYWHARDYGLMAANCFGISYFTQDPKNRGDFTLRRGEKLRFRYRLLIHEGDAAGGKVRERYHDYVNPPTITVT